MSTLVVADHDNMALSDATAKVVSAAMQLGEPVHVLVAGLNCGAVAEAAARLDGVAKVLVADDPLYAARLAENMGELVTGMMGDYTAVMCSATTMSKNFMPRVAAMLDVAQISEIVKVESADTFVRPIYAGNAMQTVQSSDAKKVITVRTTTFPATGQGGAAAIEKIPAAKNPGLSEHVGDRVSASVRPQLTSAKIIISGGRGMQSGENFKMIERVADKLKAAVGASRAAVDAGYAANDMQVGQTGKVVAPELYIAVGISGAIQHLAGMKDSKVIVAINKDEEAPIFQVSDYGLVADLFKAVPELEAELGKLGL